MPQVTVYVRKEDLEKWEAIEHKSEFIHSALNPGITGTVVEAAEPRYSKTVPVIKTVKDVPRELNPETCPHGYANGYCKKADCNRKYA